jgi:hypothetical protein
MISTSDAEIWTWFYRLPMTMISSSIFRRPAKLAVRPTLAAASRPHGHLASRNLLYYHAHALIFGNSAAHFVNTRRENTQL